MWWHKKKPPALPDRLPFKTTRGFFEMQCKYGSTRLEPGLGIVAIVNDGQKIFGAGNYVDVLFGVQKAMLKVASDDGGFEMMSETASPNGELLKPDDLVIWVPHHQSPDFARIFPDKRSAWIGTIIVAKVAPVISLTDGEFTILCSYG